MGWRDRAVKVEDVDAEAAPAKAGTWRDRAIKAEDVPADEANSTGDNLKRAANWYLRGVTAPVTGIWAPAVPDFFDVAPMKGGTELESLAKGFEQGSSVTFEDENAGVRAGAKALVTGDNPVDAYRKTRDADRASVKASHDANPKSHFVGELAGAVAVPSPAGKGSFAKAALSGARTGTVYGAGSSEADLTKGEIGQFLAETALGTAAGAAGGALGEAGGRAIGKVRNAYSGSALEKFIEDNIKAPVVDALRDTAAIRALKASGYIAKDVKPMIRRDREELRTAGQALLDEPGLITPLAKSGDIAERAGEASQKYGKQIGDLLDGVDATGAQFDPKAFADRVRKEIIDPKIVNGKIDPQMRKEAEGLQALLDDYAAMGPMKFSEANGLKGSVQDRVNWGNLWNDAKSDIPNQFRMDLQRIFHQELDDQLGPALAPHMGGKAARIVDVFKTLRSKYGPMKGSFDKAKMGEGREIGNEFFSAKDYKVGGGIAGAGGTAALVAGNPQMAGGALLLGAASAIANKIARERGSSTVAVGADRLANLLEKKWAQSLPQIIQQTPQLLGRYGPVLAREFEARGLNGVLALDRALEHEDPEYRKTKERELAARAND